MYIYIFFIHYYIFICIFIVNFWWWQDLKITLWLTGTCRRWKDSRLRQCVNSCATVVLAWKAWENVLKFAIPNCSQVSKLKIAPRIGLFKKQLRFSRSWIETSLDQRQEVYLYHRARNLGLPWNACLAADFQNQAPNDSTDWRFRSNGPAVARDVDYSERWR